MTPHDASRLLELPDSATPEQIETRFLELRTRLEDKIAKAPTPGLKAKYRETLEEITRAFETLTLAADSSALPVLKKQNVLGDKPNVAVEQSASPVGGVPSPREVHAANAKSKSKSGGKEFLVVAIIAVVVLIGGGWWVMKTKAENEEKARVAAEAKVEAERKAAEDKRLAEEARIAKEDAEKAERLQAEQLLASLRSHMAELNVTYDAAMRAEQAAERELSELKSIDRDLVREAKSSPTVQTRRSAAQVRAYERWVAWLRDSLPRHPARIARARAEELISSRAAREASVAVETFATALGVLQEDIRAQRELTQVVGRVTITSNLPRATWTLRDAWGQEFSGTVPASLPEVAAGELTGAFRHEGLKDLEMILRVEPGRDNAASGEFSVGSLLLEANLASANWELKDAHGFLRAGQTPARIELVPQGRATIVFRKTGWSDIQRDVDVTADAGTVRVAFPVGAARLTSEPAGAEVFQAGNRLGRTPLTLEGLPTGPTSWRLALTGRKSVTITSRIEEGRAAEAHATLAASLTADVPAVLAAARAEFVKITSAEEQLAAARSMVTVLRDFNGATPDDASFWVGAHLAAARKIPSPEARFEELRTHQAAAAGLDERSSRLWFDEMAGAATQVPAARLWSNNLLRLLIGDSFELHPEPVRRVLLHAASASGRSDEDWIHLGGFVAKLAQLGFDTDAQRLASRADSLSGGNYSNGFLANGRREFRERPSRLALFRRNAEQARAELNRLSAADRQEGAFWHSYAFADIGDFATATELLGPAPSESQNPAEFRSWIGRANLLLGIMTRQGDAAGFQRLIEANDIAVNHRLSATYDLAARYLEYGRVDRARDLVESVIATDKHVSGDWTEGTMLSVLCATGHQAKARTLVQSQLDKRKNPGTWIDPVALLVADDHPGFSTMLKGTKETYRWVMLHHAMRLLGFQGRFQEAGALLEANRSYPEATAARATLLALLCRRQGLGEADEFLSSQSQPSHKVHALAAVISTLKDQATLRRNKSDLLPPEQPNTASVSR